MLFRSSLFPSHDRRYQKLLEQNDLLEVLHSLTYPGKKYRTRFLISGNEKLITLQVEDIAHFYSLNKITFAVTRQNKEYIIDFPLDKLMEQLDPDKFFRTTRQTIINIESIVKIEHVTSKYNQKLLEQNDLLEVLLSFLRIRILI